MRMKVRTVGLVLAAGGLLASCSTGGVSELTPTSATLHGTVLTLDEPGSYVFQYATKPSELGTAAGKTTPRRTLPAHTPQQEKTEAVTGLQPETTYIYRLCGRQTGMEADVCVPSKRFRTPAAGSTSVTFSEPGIHTFTVPAGVTDINALVVGAAGGDGVRAGTGDTGDRVAGGLGGSIQQDLPGIRPGEVITLRVGGKGEDARRVAGAATGARGGSNGVDAGGDGGDARVANAPDVPSITPAATGAGGGAPSVVVQTLPDFTGELYVDQAILTAGAGGGGGGVGQNNLPAVGGNGGEPATTGADGSRTNAAAPFSLGGGSGDSAGGLWGLGGLGGGQDALDSDVSVFSGGDGGTAPQPTPENPCQFEWRSGGGGGGGGYGGGGGGGAGRSTLIARTIPPYPCGTYGYSSSSDGASGGGGGSNQSLALLFDVGTEPQIDNTGVNEGDGYITLSWTTP